MKNVILGVAFLVVFGLGFAVGSLSPVAGYIEAHAEQQRITNERNR